MGCLTYSEIRKIAKSVSDFTYTENISVFSEEKQLNDLLDSINNFKRALSDKTKKVNEIKERINELRRYKKTDQGCFRLMQDVVLSVKDLHASLKSQHISMNLILKHRIAEDVIADFREAIDELMISNKNLEFLTTHKQVELEISHRRSQ